MVWKGAVLNGVLLLGIAVIGLLVGLTADPAAGQVSSSVAEGQVGWGFMAAALAAGLGAIGAGIGVGLVGAAAVGAVGEHPEILGRTLIFVGLAEGIAIYGLIVAIMIFGRL